MVKIVHITRGHLQRILILLFISAFIMWFLWGVPLRSKTTPILRLNEVVRPEHHDDKIMIDSKHHHLTYKNREFNLGGKPITILSGAMHYFRIVPQYWKDRLQKLKSCGLNTVETYVSWNVHEPLPGIFDFDGILDIRRYIQLAQEVGLYVILRPGPYICSEWDFGGLPSWLLADPNMKVRSNYHGYKKAAERFFSKLLPRVEDLQFSGGGPIIAVQIENEFGSYSNEVEHLEFLKDLLLKNGITELLVTSDSRQGMQNAPFYKDALPMANFKTIEKGLLIFDHIKQKDLDFPLMTLEYWTGWFDHWGEGHNGVEADVYADVLKSILKEKSSVNLYMFHGGTNFGFMAGANFFDSYKPDVTSYDYGAPLSESGNITLKYEKTKALLMEYVLKKKGIESLPSPPPSIPIANYGSLKILSYLPWIEMLDAVKDTVEIGSATWMEMLKLSSGYGQSYGYIVYRKLIGKGDNLKFSGYVRDRAQILVDAKQVGGIVDWTLKDPEVNLQNVKPQVTLDVVVENLGRVNFVRAGSNVLNEQRKGINGTVFLDKTSLQGWKVFPLEFNKDYLTRISSSNKWQPYESSPNKPRMYKTVLTINEEPKDTFLHMKDWQKGVVFINGFNLGRYWDIGPQVTLYVPAPILKKGVNEILIFEQHQTAGEIIFRTTPMLG